MAIKFNMLRPVMKNGISHDMHSNLIVAIKLDWQGDRNPKIRENVGKPLQYANCGCHTPVFRLSR
ncbi:UNVERIFIED_CONTAM: hypothetical protein Sradi_6544100 [Sesamum radiatum]|uniref:Uncharacterized protein n=1 Tax=Sesamum radiatum TaxID=300843 RepID=A0AAW2JXN6_SESRA